MMILTKLHQSKASVWRALSLILVPAGILFLFQSASAEPIIHSEFFNQSNNPVEITWQGERSVVVVIGDHRLPMQAGSSRIVELPVDEALVVSVETPQQTYTAPDFLIIDDRENATLKIQLDDSEVVMTYGTAGEIVTAPATEHTPQPRRERTTPREEDSSLFAVGDISFGIWEFDQGDCPCELGMEIGFYKMGWFGMNRVERENRTIHHGITAGVAYRGYNYADVNTDIWTYALDAGFGYGVSPADPIFASATLHLPVYFRSITEVTFNDQTDRTEFDEWFITDALYLRMRGTVHPWINRGGFLSGVAFMASFDISLAEDGGTNFTIGIGKGLTSSR